VTLICALEAWLEQGSRPNWKKLDPRIYIINIEKEFEYYSHFENIHTLIDGNI